MGIRCMRQCTIMGCHTLQATDLGGLDHLREQLDLSRTLRPEPHMQTDKTGYMHALERSFVEHVWHTICLSYLWFFSKLQCWIAKHDKFSSAWTRFFTGKWTLDSFSEGLKTSKNTLCLLISVKNSFKWHCRALSNSLVTHCVGPSPLKGMVPVWVLG